MQSLLAQLEEDGTRLPRPAGRVPVLLPVALDQTYDYLLPDGCRAGPGAFVLVPFGPQTRIGVVWDGPVGEGGKPVADKKLEVITGPARRRAGAAHAVAALCRMGGALHAGPARAWSCA